MAALHEALTSLSPTDWDDIPKDNLNGYVKELLTSAELICNTVPPPPNGTSFADSKTTASHVNAATSHKDMHASTARSLPPDSQFEELQSQWGKPMKFSVKENPLEVAVYKMAGKDRHGGWFARRSVHEGIGFNRFRDAMKNEFAESLKVEGGPGAGCIRGIGADKRLEEQDTENGLVEVYQLSAQFPGPTTPREFLTLLVTSEAALTDKSSTEPAIPRHFMVISRPIKHADTPERSGYIRGQYESVELIREIPINKPTQTSETDTDDNTELNPVEWIMITRSDPGGGIPRFMVDRGTPSAMIGDLHKFLDWAATRGQDKPIEGSKEVVVVAPQPDEDTTTITQPTGVLQHLTSALDAYAPTMISSYVHEKLDPYPEDDPEDDSYSSTSTVDSFASATEKNYAAWDAETLSLTSNSEKRKLDHHEKKLLEIGKEREKLEQRLAKKRSEEDARLAKAQETEESEAVKAKERYEKEILKLEEKHRKEMDKLEAKREREHQKMEQKRLKDLDRDALHKVTRERDEFRSEVDLLKRENAILRERIENLEASQKQDTG